MIPGARWASLSHQRALGPRERTCLKTQGLKTSWKTTLKVDLEPPCLQAKIYVHKLICLIPSPPPSLHHTRYRPGTPALGTVRQKPCMFEANLGYIVRHYLKKGRHKYIPKISSPDGLGM